MGYEVLAPYFWDGFFASHQQSAQLISLVSTFHVLLKEAQFNVPASMLDKSHFLSLLGQFIFSKLSSIGNLRAKILFTLLIYSNCFTGTIVRRHQIPLPPPHEDQFYTIHHFNINTEVTFYGRKYKIVDCDLYTKNFLRKIGIRVNPPASLPDDPYTTERQKVRGGSSSENLIWIKLDLNAY